MLESVDIYIRSLNWNKADQFIFSGVLCGLFEYFCGCFRFRDIVPNRLGDIATENGYGWPLRYFISPYIRIFR